MHNKTEKKGYNLLRSISHTRVNQLKSMSILEKILLFRLEKFDSILAVFDLVGDGWVWKKTAFTFLFLL